MSGRTLIVLAGIVLRWWGDGSDGPLCDWPALSDGTSRHWPAANILSHKHSFQAPLALSNTPAFVHSLVTFFIATEPEIEARIDKSTT
jgi:hypothetical protein